MEQMLGFALFPSRAAAVALSAFGVLAVVLAATGIQGLVAYAVSKRRREIGIRIAIGASASNILRVVLGRIVTLIAIGAAVGLVLAGVAGRLLASVVYQASARDPIVLGGGHLRFAAIRVLSRWARAR